MFDARIGAYSSVVLLVFLMQQQYGSTAEEFSSDGTSIIQDIISVDQQTFSTVDTPRRTNFADLDNYDEIESKPTEKNVQKYNKDVDHIYRDITHNGYNKKKRKRDRETFTSRTSGEGDQGEDFDGYEITKTGSNDYKDWVTNRRVHSTFERHKAHHRNNRRYGHKSYKKSFGKYTKYEHHRRKHKAIMHHQLHHPFNQKPYYQGQVSYYGDDDTPDGRADKSFHLPAKKGSHHRYDQHLRRTGAGGGHHNIRANGYPNSNMKWPHLSRIEYQISQDERLEKNEEDKLPPYIRKYNRRNKQLLDLLEGTLPPSTTSPFPSMLQDDKDDYESSFGGSRRNEKREKSEHVRYHNHKNPKWIMEDLFEEQRANPNNPNIEDDQYLNDSAMSSKLPESFEVASNEPKDGQEDVDERDEHLKIIRHNELPSGIINASQDSEKHHNSILRGEPFVSDLIRRGNATSHGAAATPPNELVISPKANLFIFHRVASPRAVGTGTNVMRIGGGSKKQSLPFVAITERRLETSKTKQKEFEQNHLPLP